jgi:hypothetical protein
MTIRPDEEIVAFGFCSYDISIVSKRERQKTANERKRAAKLVDLLRNALEAASDESGWAHLGAVGRVICPSRPRNLTLGTTDLANLGNSPQRSDSSM